MQQWLSREEALAMLGVRPQTLYAYVSRRLIERRTDPDDPRRSHYRGEDILALTCRRARGRRRTTIAASAMAWGEPVIRTSISTVRHGRLIFRGRDAGDLAETATLEEVAALLWQQSDMAPFREAEAAPDPFVALAALVAKGRSMLGRSPARLVGDASEAVAVLTAAFGGHGTGPIHQRLVQGWSVDARHGDLVRRVLVLLADHELNPSTFATRVAASTGASLPASLLAGLATLSGPRHGGAGATLAALLTEAAAIGTDAAVMRWLAAGHQLPGFGHPLYPHGDPRCAALLAHVTLDPALEELRNVVVDATDAAPNIDFAVLAITRAAALPPDAAFRLFAVARSVGWAAHAMEQAASGGVIRPRAIYDPA
ncbi:citrate synthase [Sphingomonas sp. AR_OL41]|uniref:citrate synthase n=1 Tax=Sphingomonas sp. AR_OL41 TaxID=3042729 RepID=UPI002480B6E5|nr:citrate synthase [Sphingomonas sp. AR_OL41]MDH7974784.1 citrate synthase [Sphingomonas sp. AR_OL41]